jgi:predicted enzyme related to lactoylglutathione lyase
VDIEGIEVAFYHANDKETSLRFYRDVLGLKHVADFGEWQEFDVRGSRFGVDTGNTASEIPNAVVAFRVPDLDAAIRELHHHGVEPASPIIDVGRGRFVAIQDPAGNLVNLYALNTEAS